MGSQYQATCRQGGHVFSVKEGGGFFFYLLHCEQCGKEKSVSQEEKGEAFAAEEAVQDTWIQEHVSGWPCGGRFTMEALARCPKCKSDDWEADPRGPTVMYD